MEYSRVELNGVKIYPFSSFEQLLSFVNGRKGILVAINSGKIYNATDQTRRLINENIGYIDGLGALKGCVKKGAKDAVIIPGCELWLKIIESTYRNPDISYYFVGGKQEVIDNVIDKLKSDYPSINIKGYRNGYISSEHEKEVLIQDISTKKPDYVFVAMGSPKQELLMEEMYKAHPAVYQGLGGSFDVYTGRIKRAPKWFRDHKMEGIYRVVSDLSVARLKRFWKDLKFMINLYLEKY